MNKKEMRKRRARKTRARIRELDIFSLSVHRTPRHIYAQVISSDGQSVITTASTISKEIKKDLSSTSNKEAAALVGKLIAEKSKSKGIEKVAFDRSGFKYHGRVKALAEAAREAGLNF
jgi:large subunit ribosomal protein L18|tara:strand:+ start:24380 stop:24733 length:354 start_codon:yes stop_codon:yes gene_type:complete